MSAENTTKEASSLIEMGPKDWRELKLLRRTIGLAFCKECKIHTNFHLHKLLTPVLPCLLTLRKLAESTCLEGGRSQGPRTQPTSKPHVSSTPSSRISLAGFLRVEWRFEQGPEF